MIMSNGVNEVTIRRLERVIDAIDAQRYGGYSCGDYNPLVASYTDMLAVREDMRQQARPIGGRYIGPEDRKAVDDALDALHSAIMCRHEADECAVCEALEKLTDYLRQAVGGNAK